MGTAQSTDEQKTTALEAENEKLKEEIKRLKLKLGESQDDDADSGADSGVDSGPDSGTDSGREETPSMEYVSDDNMSIEEMITRGLRLQPLFDEKGECVEVVATVVDDIKVDPPGEDSLKENAPKKKKKKGDKKKKKKKKISQTKKMKKHQRPSRRKTPIIVAQVDVESLMHAVDVEENEDIIQKARNLKRKVLEDALKHDPTVRLVEDASTIEDLLEAELKKGEHSAFYFVNLGAVVEKWFQWTKYFPTITPFYAMKSNPDIHIVRTLHYLGTGFDCASKAELDEAISVGVPADKIIFANPCKGKEHILFAKQIGVEMMTFDSMDELNKIYSLYPTAKLVLRILPDDSHSLMPFGTKFGASYSEACKLIIHCAKLGAQLIGVSFHVGSGCFSSMAWIDAISLAKRVFDQAEKQGFKLTLLDIGGGWPGTDNGPLIIEDINEAINRHLKELFPPEVKIIAEPGRFFCTSSYTLAVTVTSRRERYRAMQDRIEAEKSAQKALEEGDNPETTPEEPLEREKEVLYYLSDGVYGSFNNIVFDHAKPSPATFKDPNSATRKSCLFGPTCDSIDVICKDIDLPEMEIGDWLYFMNMGAYTVASASNFNGFSPPNAFYVVCIDNPKTKVASPQLPASNSEKH